MKTRTSHILGAALCAAACAAATVGPAHASGLLIARSGGEWGHPMTDHLSALYYNPAGLALLDGTQLTLSGSFIWRAFTYDRDPNAIDTILPAGSNGAGTPEGAGVAANSGEANLFNIVASPFFAVGSDFGVDGFGAALAFFAPIGGQTVFDKSAPSDQFPGAVDSPARWWTIEGVSRSLYGSLGAAYRIAPARLSIGLGVDVVFTEIDNVQALNADGTDDLVAAGNLKEGRARVDVSGVDLGLGVGLLWEPIDNLFIGVSYRSQPGFGEQTLAGDVTMILGGGPVADDPTTRAVLKQSLPDVVRFGVRYGEPEAWQVRLFGYWARWSALEQQCILNTEVPGHTCAGDTVGKLLVIPRDWHDGFEVRGGGSVWLGPGVELALGASFDSNAAPDSTIEPAYYDGDKITLSLGAHVALVEGLRLEATYTQVIYPERTVAPRAEGFVPEHRVPDSAGTYTHSVGVLELGLSYTF